MCKCYNNPIILQFFLSDSGEVIQDQETSRQSLEAQAGTVQAGSVTAPVLPGGSERQSQRGNVLTCRRHCTHIHRIHRHRIHHQAESLSVIWNFFIRQHAVHMKLWLKRICSEKQKEMSFQEQLQCLKPVAVLVSDQ